MSEGNLEGVLKSVDPNRRGFIQKVIGGAAFAAPLVASFSVDSLTAEAAESCYCNATNVTSIGRNDVGYAGPGFFQSHVSSCNTRENGEVQFVLVTGSLFSRGPSKVLQVTVTLTPGSSWTQLQILICGNTVVTLNAGETSITASSLPPGLDFDALLEAFADREATVVVSLSDGNTLEGDIHPGNVPITVLPPG